MTYVPQPLSLTQGAQLILVDYPDDIQQSALVGADGTATITTDSVPLGYYWRIERMTTVVSQTKDGLPILTPGGAALSVYKAADGVGKRPIMYRDGSASPGLDVADESQPITVQQGYALVFLWSGLTAGTYASVSVQYALLRRVNGGAA
jgi:hypothetical protein